MKRSRPVSLALVGLFVWVTGCHSYRVIPVEEVAEHGSVRITLTSGERTTLREASVTRDSIRGRVWEGRPRPKDVQRSFPIDHVTEVEAKGTDVADYVVLAVLVGGAIAIGIGIGSSFP